MEFCCGFLVVAGLLAVVGHGIWVVAAAALKALFGSPEPPRPVHHRRRVCPGCECTLLPTDRRCPRCGLDQDDRLAAQLEHVRYGVREVAALAERGELDAETADRVTARLRDHIRALAGQPVPTAVPVEPAATPAQPPDELRPPHLTSPFDWRTGRPIGMPPDEARPPDPAVAPAPVVPAPAASAPEQPAPVAAEDSVPEVSDPEVSVPEVSDPEVSDPEVSDPEDSDPEEVPEVVPPPEPPHRRGMLAGFMEERNIFWGELVGGLLIVGCSIALVLSLWRRLEELPYFPFLLAATITTALFGAGQYTLHHWRLAATSRGLLVIALLLAPLNLLLLALPGVETAGGLLDAAVKLAALAAFVGMVRAAGRDLIGTDLLPGPVDRRWLLALAVVAAPATLWVPDPVGGLSRRGGRWRATRPPARPSWPGSRGIGGGRPRSRSGSGRRRRCWYSSA
ncbi:MAG TPA: hypothetical protein VH092_16425 [Urbifossiella sp.]|nr:hypothetical protein [Urbifossiella sp.]